MERSTTPTSALLTAQQELSPLEQEVLDEYERLAENMKKVCLSALPPTSSSPPIPSIALLPTISLLRLVRIYVLDPHSRRTDRNAQLASQLDDLASAPATDILDGLRELERKTSLVFTLLKASVYSIVLQQEMGQ